MTINKFKKIIFLFLLVFSLLTAVPFALAGNITGWGEAGTGGDAATFQANTGLANTDPRVVAARIIRIALGFLGIIAVGLIIYAGWLWMTAGGESDKIEKAKKILIGAVIGLIIILSAFAIASFILSRLLEATGGSGDGDGPGGGGPGPGGQAAVYGSDVSNTSPENGDARQPMNTTPSFDFYPAIKLENGKGPFMLNNKNDRQYSLTQDNYALIKGAWAAGLPINNPALPPQLDITALNADFKLEKVATIDKKTGLETPIPAEELKNSIKRVLEIPSQVDAWGRQGYYVYKFIGGGACGDADPAKNTPDSMSCLEKWSKYKATISGAAGIFSVGTRKFECLSGEICEFYFSTDESYDREKPLPGITPAQMCQDDGTIDLKPEANIVSGWANDDTLVAGLSFRQQKKGGPEVNVKYVSGSDQYLQSQHKYNTRPTAEGEMKVGDEYTFSIYAQDGASNFASASFTTKIKPGHCCNGIKDQNETDIDCGGDCLACAGSACAADMSKPQTCSNTICASSFCTTEKSDAALCSNAGYNNSQANASCCLCQQRPSITAVSPEGGFCNKDINRYCRTKNDCAEGDTCNKDTPNGAAGNFLTISGYNFGETAGQVFISDKEASLATSVNNKCVDSWKDNQIIVVVPAGVAGGPVKVQAASGFYDLTNDTNGPPLDDFILNNIKRPGLCLVENKNSARKDCFGLACGYLGDAFNVQGNAFNAASRSVLFGNTTANVTAANINNWSNSSVDGAVPNLRDGLTSVFVAANNVNSNYLSFNVKDDPNMNPAISYVDPAKGPAGQYVTIYGRNFKSYDAQKSRVEFYWPQDPNKRIMADIDFPKDCQAEWWHDTYIVVKAPRGLTNLGLHKIIVTNSYERTSGPADFTLNNDPVSPGLCRLDPDNGPVGQAVFAKGEKFGSTKGSSRVVYYNNKNGQVPDVLGTQPGWADQQVISNVPAGAASGPVKITRQDETSNSLPFKVGKCSASAECEAGDECCGSGTYWSGICRPEGSCSIGSGIECAYGWQFKAKYAPPGQGQPCYEGATGPTCDLSKNKCDQSLNLVCKPDKDCTCQEVQAGDPCDGDTAKPSCQADQTKCGNNLTCNPFSCECEEIKIGYPCYPGGVAGRCDRDKNECSKAGLSCDWNTCFCKIPDGAGGESCKIDGVAACSSGAGSCDASAGYACINKDAADCRCCCDPKSSPDKTVGSVTLKCVKNQAPCDGENRGLYCGCTNDGQCGAVGSGLGCGLDGCCHARPEVTSTVPLDGTGINDNKKVCRNALIQATFSEAMQLASFTNNVIVLGDYELKSCPAGTEYLTKYNPPNPLYPADAEALAGKQGGIMPSFLAKARRLMENIPLVNKLIVKKAEAVEGNFCVVKGTVSGYDNAAKNQSTMEFRPEKVLDPDRKYYVIIKGETNDQDALKEGVLSLNNIGLAISQTQSFNGIAFKGKIWSFMTKPQSAENSGICELESVRINPYSYLFNKSASDQTKSIDKVFTATAYSSDLQPLSPMPGWYNWRWDWVINDESVVKFTSGLPVKDNAGQISSSQPLSAQSIEEGDTIVTAKATITQDALALSAGKSETGMAEVYVFLCSNPWPIAKADGSWQPWRDADTICAIPGSRCNNTNFEFYYCRDNGEAGTANDLPAIYNNAIIGKSTSLKCSDGSGSCEGRANGAICGDGSGQCQNDILKEFYYFREDLPSIVDAKTFKVTALPEGGKVRAEWQKVNGATGYKLYYGTASKKYNNSVNIQGANVLSKEISGLANGRTYYFALTSYNDKGAESSYSAEQTATPKDTLAPNIPTEIFVSQKDATSAYVVWMKNTDYNIAWKENTPSVVWMDNIDDTASYKIYYGANKSFGTIMNINKNKCADSGCAIQVPNLHPGTEYHFAVSALDEAGNESAKTETKSLVISNQAGIPQNLELAPINFTSASGTALLSWTANRDQTTSYKIYYWELGQSTGKTITVTKEKCSSTVCTATVEGLNKGKTYTFAVSALGGINQESPKTLRKALKIDDSNNDQGKISKCRADLINILATIGRKRDELNKPLAGVTGEFCSDCCCRADFISSDYCKARVTAEHTACENDMANAFKKLGYSGVVKDPWGDPYYINEDEYEINYFLINGLTPLCGHYSKDANGAFVHDELRSVNAACGGMTGGLKVPNYYCPN